MTIESEQRRKLTHEEAGRKGGEKVAKERGIEFYREIGRKGGKSKGSRSDKPKSNVQVRRKKLNR